MLFNSIDFGLFLATCVCLVLMLPHRAQNRLLLVASYLFYASWDWRFLGLIWISTLVDYVVGMRLGTTVAPGARRRLLIISLVTNLGILGAFKYAAFFADSLHDLMRVFGIELGPFTLHIVLPVGISFYTFQTLSYTIDVYRGRLAPTRGLLDFALFVAFFPQLVAGPIERAARLLPQVTGPRRVSWEGVRSGLWLILWGTFKKVVIADNLAALVDGVYAPGAHPTGAEVLIGTYAFAVQIYCDFSGYSNVARGAAQLLGFELMLNFNLPYGSSSPAEFWHRWHISLSTWLRDYLYIPLGGNRGGRWYTYRNLLLTMLLGGLWHGAAWTFVMWGFYHGVLLVLHRLMRPILGQVVPRSPGLARGWDALCVVVTFHLVCVGWLVFRAGSLGQAGALLAALGHPADLGLASGWVLPLVVLVMPLVLVEVAQARAGDLEVVLRWPMLSRAATYAALVIAIVLLGEDFGQPFIYFQF